MRIDFLRTGGLAGLRLSLSVETGDLPPEEAARLMKLIESARLPKRAAKPSKMTTAPDRFEYRLTIASGARRKSAFVWHESHVSDEVRPLLEYLTALATRQNRPDRAGDLPSP